MLYVIFTSELTEVKGCESCITTKSYTVSVEISLSVEISVLCIFWSNSRLSNTCKNSVNIMSMIQHRGGITRKGNLNPHKIGHFLKVVKV